MKKSTIRKMKITKKEINKLNTLSAIKHSLKNCKRIQIMNHNKNLVQEEKKVKMNKQKN